MTANEILHKAAHALTEIPPARPDRTAGAVAYSAEIREAVLIMEQIVYNITVRGDKRSANEELGRLLRLVEKSKEGE